MEIQWALGPRKVLMKKSQIVQIYLPPGNSQSENAKIKRTRRVSWFGAREDIRWLSTRHARPSFRLRVLNCERKATNALEALRDNKDALRGGGTVRSMGGGQFNGTRVRALRRSYDREDP